MITKFDDIKITVVLNQTDSIKKEGFFKNKMLYIPLLQGEIHIPLEKETVVILDEISDKMHETLDKIIDKFNNRLTPFELTKSENDTITIPDNKDLTYEK